jgi:hypothetical protein
MNESIILPLFSTPVYISNINTGNALNYVKSLEYTPGSYKDKDELIISNCFMADNYYILNDPVLAVLKKNIEVEINCFLKDQLRFSKKINFYLTTSWVIKHQNGNYSQSHYHPNSLYSGVVYLQVNENSGCISFENNEKFSPLYPTEMQIEIEEYNMLNSIVWSYLPKNNDIIIFPSRLKHSVSANNSKIDRYIIAFNIYPSGILGKNTINEITI